MSIEAEIQRLCSLADPLRELLDEDPAKEPLTGIVDAINKLRAEQAHGVLMATTVEPEAVEDSANPPKRGPGRPKKAE